MVSQNSTFNMTGGVIKDNHVYGCEGAAGGVFIERTSATFNKTGGIIYGGGAGSGLANTSNGSTYTGHAVIWNDFVTISGIKKVDGDKLEGDIVSTSPVMGFDP